MSSPEPKRVKVMSETKSTENLRADKKAAINDEVGLHAELLLIVQDKAYKYSVATKQLQAMSEMKCGFGDSRYFIKDQNNLYSINSDNYGDTIIQKGTVSSDQEWIKIPSTIEPRIAGGFAFCDGFLYAVGGTYKEWGVSSRSGEMYSFANKTWTTISRMNSSRAHHAMVAYQNELYTFGGYDVDLHCSDSVECYHPSKDAWSELPSMNFAREKSVAVVCNEEIYVIGGYNADIENADNSDAVCVNENANDSDPKNDDDAESSGSEKSEDFDPNGTKSAEFDSSDSGSTFSDRSDVENAQCFDKSDIENSDSSYISSDSDCGYKVPNSVEKFSPKTGEWHRVASLSESRKYGHCACAIGSKIYVAGGDSSVLEVLDVSRRSNKWQVEATFIEIYRLDAMFPL